jgi:long-chain acyl-CoA synthetase
MNKPWFKSYDPYVPRTLEYSDATLADFLMDTAVKYPDNVATTFNDIDLTYRQINEKVNGFAHALRDLGVKKGHRVALVLPNSPTYVIAFYAIMKIGAVVVNINVMSHGTELAKFLNDSDSEIVITLDLFVNNVAGVIGKTALKTIIVHSVFGLEKKLDLGGQAALMIFNDLVSAQAGAEPGLDCSADDIAVLQYTSGSTGTPKAAILTHRTIVSNVIQINSWDLEPNLSNAAVFCIIPFFHVFGMTICLHLSVFKGFKMVLFPMFDWSSIVDFLTAIKKYQPISFPAVPALWAALVSHTEADQYQLASIGIASGGGAPLPIWVQEKYYQLTGKKISQAYGLSEVSSASHMNPFVNGSISDSIGLPLPDTDVKIVDIDTGETECPVGEIGEMIIKGPQVMQGYWKDPKRTEQTLRNGWLFTGDLARMDADGYFYLVDRKDDMIISSGFNVYPSDVENVLLTHPAVEDAGVVGAPDRIRGETIIAYVVIAADSKVTRQELLELCRQQLPAYKVPRMIRFKDEIPKNKVGKPLRRILRDET